MDIQKIMDDIQDVEFEDMDKISFGHEQGVLISGNEAQQFVDAWRALEMLVKAKLIKDNQGETPEYTTMKSQAWNYAFRCFDTNKILKEQAQEILNKMSALSAVHDKIKSQINEK